MTEKIRQVNIKLSPDLWTEFRKKCLDLDVPIYKTIAQLIRNWIDDN